MYVLLNVHLASQLAGITSGASSKFNYAVLVQSTASYFFASFQANLNTIQKRNEIRDRKEEGKKDLYKIRCDDEGNNIHNKK